MEEIELLRTALYNIAQGRDEEKADTKEMGTSLSLGV